MYEGSRTGLSDPKSGPYSEEPGSARVHIAPTPRVTHAAHGSCPSSPATHLILPRRHRAHAGKLARRRSDAPAKAEVSAAGGARTGSAVEEPSDVVLVAGVAAPGPLGCSAPGIPAPLISGIMEREGEEAGPCETFAGIRRVESARRVSINLRQDAPAPDHSIKTCRLCNQAATNCSSKPSGHHDAKIDDMQLQACSIAL